MNSKEISKRLHAISLLEDLQARRNSATNEIRRTKSTVTSKNSRERITEKYEAQIELIDALIPTLQNEINKLESLEN